MTVSDYAAWTPECIREVLLQYEQPGSGGIALLRAADGRVISRGYAGMGDSLEIELSEEQRAIVEDMIAKGQLTLADDWANCPEPKLGRQKATWS